MTRSDLKQAFLAKQGLGSAAVTLLAGDASFRKYDRVTLGNQSWVLMDAPPEKEDVIPFVAVAQWLVQQGLMAPSLKAMDLENGFLLLDDLGDETFTKVLKKQPEAEKQLYFKAIDALVTLHQCQTPSLIKVSHGANESALSHKIADYNQQVFETELSLFTDWYLPALDSGMDVDQHRQEMLALWRPQFDLMMSPNPVMVLRDYHADNLMRLTSSESIGLLDFQDALRGHPAYDLVSLLLDARRDVPAPLAQQCVDYYCQKAGIMDREAFGHAYDLLGAQRNMKIIGIFTRLSHRDGKHHYPKMNAHVWRLLERGLENPLLHPLRDWLDEIIPDAKRNLDVAKKSDQGAG